MDYKLPSDGEIIAYRPILEPGDDVQIYSPDRFDEDSKFNFTIATQQVSENLPSHTIDTLDRLSESLWYMTTDLESRLSDFRVEGLTINDIRDAIVNGNEEMLNGYLDDIVKDINGDTRIEVYERLLDLDKESKALRETLGLLFYGNKDVDAEKAMEQDDIRCERLASYEIDGKTEKINYAAISIDAKLQKILSVHSDSLFEYSNHLYSVSNMSVSNKEDEDVGDTIRDAVVNVFNEEAFVNHEDKKKLVSIINRDLINTNTSSAYVDRGELIGLINAKESLYKLSNYSSTLEEGIDRQMNKSNESIVDLNKSIMMSAMYRDDYINSLNKKAELRDVFSTIK